MAAGTIFILAAAAATCALTEAQSVELASPALRIGDVASLECVPSDHRNVLARLEIATLDEGRAQPISREALATLIRRRAPVLGAIALSGEGDETIALVAPARERPITSQENCFVARQPIDQGDVIVAGSVERASCVEGPPSEALRYDRRHGLMRAARFIAAGDHIGPMAAPPIAAADAGEELSLVVRAGPVVIERRVEAAAPSAGDRVFVRGDDGEVFSVPMAPSP